MFTTYLSLALSLSLSLLVLLLLVVVAVVVVVVIAGIMKRRQGQAQVFRTYNRNYIT